MGFTGLARWVNAPTTGLQLVRDNIIYNHNGQLLDRWSLSVRSYRSTLGQIPGLKIRSERTMCALTMGENVFVLLEDPAAPARAESLAAPAREESLAAPAREESLAAPEGKEQSSPQPPTHYRTTFLTLRPKDALEQLLAQLKARWVSIRQPSSSAPQRAQGGGQQLQIEGFIFSIGNDWLVRVGNVTLTGGSIKGMLLEAEYLPLPALHSTVADGTSDLLSNLILSVLPNIRDAKTVAVTISDAEWEDVLWNREEDGQEAGRASEEKSDDDDIFAYGYEDISDKKVGDWVGVDRDRRSAFLIIGALRSEGII